MATRNPMKYSKESLNRWLYFRIANKLKMQMSLNICLDSLMLLRRIMFLNLLQIWCFKEMKLSLAQEILCKN